MRKLLLWLLGLLLMAILAYFCFSSRNEAIQEHILSDADAIYQQEDMPWVKTGLLGEGFGITRVLKLEGEAPTMALKERAGELGREVEGVASVENNLHLASAALVAPVVSEKEEAAEDNISVVAADTQEEAKATVVDVNEPIDPTLEQKPVVVEVATTTQEQKEKNVDKELNTTKVEVPSPYTLQVTKNASGVVTLMGYVLDEASHKSLVLKAEELFMKENVIDQLKVVEGAPSAWSESALLGLSQLHSVDYGELSMSDDEYTFKGYLSDVTAKEALLEEFEKGLDQSYHGTYKIDTPEVAKTPQKEEESSTTALSCQKKFQETMLKGKVHFAYNRAGIKPDSFALLNKIVAIAKECPNEIIMIGGHTDSVGSKEYNQALSEKRAISVKKYLVSKGLKAEKIESHGYGETQPIADNMERKGRAKNRRIEITVKGVQK